MGQPMSDMPDSFGESLLRETRDLARALDRTLRGSNGHVGLVAKVDRLEERQQEIKDDVADVKRQLRLKMFPASDEPASLKARAEAFAIRAGVGLAFLTAIIEAWQWFIGTGGTP